MSQKSNTSAFDAPQNAAPQTPAEDQAAAQQQDTEAQTPAEDQTAAPQQDAEAEAPADKMLVLSRTLKIEHPHIKGADVKAVQQALIEKKYHCGKDGANGVYNPATAFAIRCLQADTGRPVTGIVDRFTAEALGGAMKTPKKQPEKSKKK
jgi:peptidoglycan hydrolase-like protein with peptidoglycan-binding domain